jgi:hypothetical protein
LKKKNSASAKITAALSLVLSCLFISACARYAPVPQAPTKSVLDITLTFNDRISNDFYYYIVLDASGNPSSDGPHEELSSVNRLKNWSYYIVLDHGYFYELPMTGPIDGDTLPAVFNNSSPRDDTATFASDTIHLSINLDPLAPTPRKIWMNFITSQYPIYANRNDIIPIDYLTPPYFSINSTDINNPVTSFTNQNISGHVPSGQGFQAADLIYWRAAIITR